MKWSGLTVPAALKFYRRFDYGSSNDNHLKDLASIVAITTVCIALSTWVWALCVIVMAYRTGVAS
ncbi:hypothetical protein [Pseudovibrio sp. SPO723]|uniref:hypothetical protein n=1 Tax=Nesiotobacter zosterae TaxID=392721 RepID=UPI0029C2D36B|nr:hypothetical protein [Pseudovibrio sp. SPO723]MDX5595292.1 hypothetical protein [Pseudovibrio sp. SPO723]